MTRALPSTWRLLENLRRIPYEDRGEMAGIKITAISTGREGLDYLCLALGWRRACSGLFFRQSIVYYWHSVMRGSTNKRGALLQTPPPPCTLSSRHALRAWDSVLEAGSVCRGITLADVPRRLRLSKPAPSSSGQCGRELPEWLDRVREPLAFGGTSVDRSRPLLNRVGFR